MGAIETEILGFANGTVTASGRLADARDRVAFVNITELDAGIAGVPVSLLSPLNAELRGDDVTLKDLFVRVGSGRLTRVGRMEHPPRRQLPARSLPATSRTPCASARRSACRSASTAAGAMQFDLQQQRQPRSAPSARWRSRTAPSAGSARPAAVQDLNINAALERRAADHRAHHRQRRDRRRRRQLLRERRRQAFPS